MDILPVNFKALRFCGAWKEREDNNMCVGFLRLCYRYVIHTVVLKYIIKIIRVYVYKAFPVSICEFCYANKAFLLVNLFIDNLFILFKTVDICIGMRFFF